MPTDHERNDMPKCELCGEPMPEGESMFKYHGYSGPCPKPPLPRASPQDRRDALANNPDERDCYLALAVMALVVEECAKVCEQVMEDAIRTGVFIEAAGACSCRDTIRNLPGRTE